MDTASEEKTENTELLSETNTRVSLCCNSCQSDLGVFENKWIRLTSSYARPLHGGTHHGTIISDRTRVVRTQTGRQTAEGCSMADVTCQKCATTVGQYCKEAPSPSKQYLVGIYFYKLSKSTLKSVNPNPLNTESLAPVFTYEEEMDAEIPDLPVPSVVAPDPKWSHPPPAKLNSNESYHAAQTMAPPNRSFHTLANRGALDVTKSTSKYQSSFQGVARRTGSARNSSVSSHMRNGSVRSMDAAGASEGLLALRRVLGQDAMLAKINAMMESMQCEIRKLRASSGLSTAVPLDQIADVEKSQAQDDELRSLRAENEAMKRVLRTLPPQMQFEHPRYSQEHDDEVLSSASRWTVQLGKRKRDQDYTEDSLLFEEDGITESYDDFDEPMNEVSGLATLEQDNAEQYSVWQGPVEQSDGDESVDNEDESGLETQQLSIPAVERQSARSRERRQTLPADFIAEEQRYLLSDSNDENFDPDDVKTHGRKHKRTRSAERRRRERVERQQDSLWKQGVPGGGYENGDGWVEQKRHHSGRFGRKAAMGDGPAVYPKSINHRLYANGRQVLTAQKRLARELVYLGLDDWIDKDKSDPLYRRTIRVARKHYAYHHGGISSKSLCQGKYTKKDLEAVGMWDDELFEEINIGEESDVEKLDFPLDPALQKSIEKWTAEGAKAKERKKAANEAANGSETSDANRLDVEQVNADDTSQQPGIHNPEGMTQFSDDEGIVANSSTDHVVPQVSDRIERHSKFDSIWQAQLPNSENPVLSIIQHAEARIKAAEDDMGEPTFKTKRAQRFKTIGPSAEKFVKLLADGRPESSNLLQNDRAEMSLASLPNESPAAVEDGQLSSANTMVETANISSNPTLTCDTFSTEGAIPKCRPGRTVAEDLERLDISGKGERTSFLRELRAYFAVDGHTGVPFSIQQQIAFTDKQLKRLSVEYLESQNGAVRGNRKNGLRYWPDDGSRKLSYVADRDEITENVYDLFVIQRYNKAKRLRHQLNKSGEQDDSVVGELSVPRFLEERSPSPTPQAPPESAVQSTLRDEVKPGLPGDRFNNADGAPRSAKNAARLERRAAMSTEVAFGTMPVAGDSSELEGSVLQTATAMRQLTGAFDASNELAEDEMRVAYDENKTKSLDLGNTASANCQTEESGTNPASVADNFGLSHRDDKSPSAATDATSPAASLASRTRDTTKGKGLGAISLGNSMTKEKFSCEVDKTPQPARGMSTRSASRVSNSVKTLSKVTTNLAQTKQVVIEVGANVLESPSNKENAAPESDLDSQLTAKKAKIMGSNRSSRSTKSTAQKSFADLDELAKETMERETRSAGRRSRSGLYFGLRQSL